jgi:dTDP-4-amino-4,6-dideoxygalactose transaminase
MREALAFSRASTGLYALLVALRKRDGPGEVVLPTLCCESVALAVLYSGHSLRFCDVSAESLCMTPVTLGAVLSEKTRAVLLIHLYGVDADVRAFDSLRQAFPQAAFIEDIAHAIGGADQGGQLLGGGMDYALASFADSKILPGDGGVLLFGAEALAPALVSAEIDTAAPRLEQGIAGLTKNRSSRYARYLHYADRIRPGRARIPRLHAASTCWRCPLIFADGAQASALTARLRAAGIPASNHYVPLSVLFGAAACPVGENLGLRIVNLWVDEGTDLTAMNMAIDIINQN